MTKHYETMFILKPTLNEEEAAAKIAQFEEIITNNGGEVVATEKLGVKNLAYAIDKFERGNYTVIYYTAADGKLNKELERVYRITEDILRHIVIKYERKVEIAAWENMVKRAKGEEHKAVKLSESSQPRGPRGPRGPRPPRGEYNRDSRPPREGSARPQSSEAKPAAETESKAAQ